MKKRIHKKLKIIKSRIPRMDKNWAKKNHRLSLIKVKKKKNNFLQKNRTSKELKMKKFKPNSSHRTKKMN